MIVRNIEILVTNTNYAWHDITIAHTKLQPRSDEQKESLGRPSPPGKCSLAAGC